MERDEESFESKKGSEEQDNLMAKIDEVEQKLVNLLIRIIVDKTLSEYYEKSN